MISNQMRQLAPFPVPSQWEVYITSGGRPNTTGMMQITSWQSNRFQGTMNFRGVPLPLTGTWDPSSMMLSFESPYIFFQGRLVSFADEIARYWKIEGRYLSKVSSDYPGAQGIFIATTTTL